MKSCAKNDYYQVQNKNKNTVQSFLILMLKLLTCPWLFGQTSNTCFWFRGNDEHKTIYFFIF